MKPPPRPDIPSPGDDALDALFDTARAARPDTSRAEFGFETRLSARLAAGRVGPDGWQELAAWCWRLLPACAVLTLACALWMLRPDAASPAADPFFAAASPAPPADDDDLARWFAVEWLAPI